MQTTRLPESQHAYKSVGDRRTLDRRPSGRYTNRSPSTQTCQQTDRPVDCDLPRGDQTGSPVVTNCSSSTSSPVTVLQTVLKLSSSSPLPTRVSCTHQPVARLPRSLITQPSPIPPFTLARALLHPTLSGVLLLSMHHLLMQAPPLPLHPDSLHPLTAHSSRQCRRHAKTGRDRLVE